MILGSANGSCGCGVAILVGTGGRKGCRKASVSMGLGSFGSGLQLGWAKVCMEYRWGCCRTMGVVLHMDGVMFWLRATGHGDVITFL